MAWAHYRETQYSLSLTDGYVDRAFSIPCNWPDNIPTQDQAPEQLLASYLYTSAKGRARHRGPQESNVHVWVIGEEGWTQNDHPSIDAITQGEDNPDYRVVITASDPASIYFDPAWLRYAGMKKKRVNRPSLQGFRAGARAILEPMAAAYLRSDQPPTAILEELGVPVTFRGDQA